MKVTFIGTGYVGLVSGTCFAEMGHDIICVDIHQEKINGLNRGELPIYEPGLDTLVQNNVEAGRLQFTTDLAAAVVDSEVIFIAVGTPQRKDGSADLDYIWAAVDQIREAANSSKLVVIKSTVPVGTNRRAQNRLNRDGRYDHVVASNPEFLREGLAVGDAMHPDRVVLGVEDPHAREQLTELYQPFAAQDVPILYMRRESAEMTKYVANCLLATKISFINEMANMCEAVQADVNDVRQGIGYDQRIGFQFLAPGAGYGGSCFPKDVRAMKSMAREKKMPMRILEAVDYVNEEQKRVAFQKLSSAFNGHLEGTTVAIWGLAFKPETDDIREAPALVLIDQLLQAGAIIRAYDPQATNHVAERLGERLGYVEDMYDATIDVDALVIMTEWSIFREADFELLRSRMNGNVIVDGRNLFDPEVVAEHGFVYSSVGRQTAYPGFPADSTDLLEQPLTANWQP